MHFYSKKNVSQSIGFPKNDSLNLARKSEFFSKTKADKVKPKMYDYRFHSFISCLSILSV